MYQTGELIVYGNTGVCRIEAISSKRPTENQGEKLYYTIVPLYQPSCVIYAPVEDCRVFTRPIISKQEALALLDAIPAIDAAVCPAGAAKDMAQRYAKTLQTYECADLAALAKAIYAKKEAAKRQRRKFAQVDERFMKRIQELLFGELAAALKMHKDEIPQYIRWSEDQDVPELPAYVEG